MQGSHARDSVTYPVSPTARFRRASIPRLRLNRPRFPQAHQEEARKPYHFSYSADGHDGGSAREERADGNGRVTGWYTIVTADGHKRKVSCDALKLIHSTCPSLKTRRLTDQKLRCVVEEKRIQSDPTSSVFLHFKVSYVADENGFRAKVETNEPGTANEDPASVLVKSHAAEVCHHISGVSSTM